MTKWFHAKSEGLENGQISTLHTVLASTTKSPENKEFWILEF